MKILSRVTGSFGLSPFIGRLGTYKKATLQILERRFNRVCFVRLVMSRVELPFLPDSGNCN